MYLFCMARLDLTVTAVHQINNNLTIALTLTKKSNNHQNLASFLLYLPVRQLNPVSLRAFCDNNQLVAR